MDSTTTETDVALDRPMPLLSVSASSVGELASTAPCVIRISNVDEAALIADVPAERIVWIETTPEIAVGPLFEKSLLDVVMTDPAKEFPQLYPVARVREGLLPRITIHAQEGVARAGAIALALSMSVRLLPGQPSAAVVEELEMLLDRYLHDARAVAPIEPYHSALAALIHDEPSTLWLVLEKDPNFFPRDDAPPAEEEFVRKHTQRLIESGAECASCPVKSWCGGFFKVPDPSYDCVNVRRLLGSLEDAARQLQRDFKEAEAITP